MEKEEKAMGSTKKIVGAVILAIGLLLFFSELMGWSLLLIIGAIAISLGLLLMRSNE
jgi:membrane-bound ClpP family serine protease